MLEANNPYITMGKYKILYLIYPQSALDNHIVRNGIIDDYIADNLNKFIPEDGIVFDIGANVGLITLPLAIMHVPRGKIFAYEPDIQNLYHLGTNINLNKLQNVEVFPYALQDNMGIQEVLFNIRRAIDGDGHINQGLSSINSIPLHQVKSNVVQASTIDKEIDRLELRRLDFIKIDVEGAEYRVLTGGHNTIEKFKPVIQYEYSLIIDRLSKSNNCILSFNYLKNMGYQQYVIMAEKYLELFNEPRQDIPDSNILCFHISKLPQILKIQ